MKVSLSRGVLLLLLFVGACSFPEYAFIHGPQTSTCDDGVQGPDETGIDCGGVCKACPDTNPPPVCGDRVQGPNETDIDCGGLCPPCPAGDGCKVNDDCQSGHCKQNICQAASCSDGITNGAESDVDCGGRCPALCKTGKRCNSEADCASSSCTGALCLAPSCDDRVSNGSETGVDCGGSCPACDVGMACLVAKDCKKISCDAKQLVCVDPGCADETQNGTETDIDCGGSCAPCTAKQRCIQDSDCDSSICNPNGKLCAAASCSDAVLNQGESDTDCGGSNCPGCAINRACKVPTDCASGVCQAKLCVPAAATGKAASTLGWSATASNTFGDGHSAPEQLYDGNVKTRWTSGVAQKVGMWIILDMGQTQSLFSVVLDSTPWPGDQGTGYNFYFSNDANCITADSCATLAVPTTTGGSTTLQTFTFDGAVVARYVKIELAIGGYNWWSIGELSVFQ